MYEDPGMVGFRKVTFSSSGIETLMSSCNLIQTGLFAVPNRAPLLIAAKGLWQMAATRGVNAAYTHPVFTII